jgi:hypothetical protein
VPVFGALCPSKSGLLNEHIVNISSKSGLMNKHIVCPYKSGLINKHIVKHTRSKSYRQAVRLLLMRCINKD